MSADNTLQAVCWDLDGTLIDSERYWIDSEYALVAEFGGTWSEQLAAAVIGSSLDRTAAHLISAGVALPVDEVITRISSAVAQRVITDGVPWRPGVQQLLAHLHEQGIPQAMVTMSYADNAQRVARASGDLFDVVVSGDLVSRGKPDPEPYLRAIAQLGVAPERTVAFEDSVPGLTSATSAGLTTVVVPCVAPIEPADHFTLWPSHEGITIDDLNTLLTQRTAHA